MSAPGAITRPGQRMTLRRATWLCRHGSWRQHTSAIERLAGPPWNWNPAPEEALHAEARKRLAGVGAKTRRAARRRARPTIHRLAQWVCEQNRREAQS